MFGQGLQLFNPRLGPSDRSGAPAVALAPILLLATTHFLMMADRHLPTLVLSNLKGAFALSDTRLGLLQGPAFVILYVLATVLSASFVDRLPRARFIAGAVVLWTLAGVGFGLSQTWTQLLVCRLVLGLAQAAVAPAGLSWITETHPKTTLGRAVSIFTTGSALGRSGALLIGGLVLGALGTAAWAQGLGAWRVLFLLSAIPNLIVATAFALRPTGIVSGASKPASPFRIWQTLFEHRPRRLLAHIAGACCVVLVIQATSAWMPTALQRLAGLSVAHSGVVAGFIVLIGAPIGHLGGGALVDLARGKGVSPVWVCALAVLGTLPAAGLLAVSSTLPILFLGFLLIAICGGAAGSAALGCFQLMLPQGRYGAGNAIYLAAVNLIGLGIGPPLVGVLSDRVFGPDALGLAIFGAVGVFALIGALLFVVSRTFWRASEPFEQTWI